MAAAVVLLVGGKAASLPAQLLPTGARSLALGGVTAALRADPEGVFHNPASLAQSSSASLALFFQRPFGLGDLSLGTATLSLPLRRLRVGFGFYTFGNRLFRRQAVVLATAAPLRWGIHSAVAIRYVRTSIDRYGADGALGFDLAMMMEPVPGLDWGFYIRQRTAADGTGARSGNLGEMAVGLGYHPSHNLDLIVEMYDDPQFPPDLRFGVEMRLAEVFTLRAGGALDPGRFSGGFGVQKMGIAIDYAFFTHADLGVTHQIGVVLSFARQGKARLREIRARESAGPLAVDLNTATEQALRTLPGVGARLAARIVTYRAEHGPFRSLEELLNVPGIGKQTLDRLRPFLHPIEEGSP